MNLTQLRYFVVAAEEGNFTRAAERLGVSQPALSQGVRTLERDLGSQLFERSRHGARLTPAGSALIAYAERVLADLDEARAAVEGVEGLERGTLSICVVESVNLYLLPRAVARFADLHPGVTLHIHEVVSDDVEPKVRSGRFDLGIGPVPAKHPDLASSALFSESFVMVAAADHPLAWRDPLPVRDLDGEAVLLAASASRRTWETFAEHHGLRYRVLAETSSILGALQTARHTEALVAVPALSLADAAPGLVALPLERTLPGRTVGALWRRRAYRPAASRAFVRVLAEVVGALRLADGSGAGSEVEGGANGGAQR